jgi:hypothetical protein
VGLARGTYNLEEVEVRTHPKSLTSEEFKPMSSTHKLINAE